MIKFAYCIVLLIILSGMHFVATQSSEEVLAFILNTFFISLVISLIATLLRKKRTLESFGMTSFFVILIVGVGKIVYKLVV